MEWPEFHQLKNRKQHWLSLYYTQQISKTGAQSPALLHPADNGSAKPVPRAQKQTINSKVVHCPLLRETVNQRTSIKFNLNSIQNWCPEANYKFKNIVQCPLLRENSMINQSILAWLEMVLLYSFVCNTLSTLSALDTSYHIPLALIWKLYLTYAIWFLTIPSSNTATWTL